MSRYLISDHHFGHSRIIDYTDRPFSSAAEMNQALLNRHSETVNTDDILIHLGDVAMDMRDGSETISFVDRLNGNMLIRGNHETGFSAEDATFLVAQSCVLTHGGRRFDCTHRPSDIPSEWEG